MNVKAVVVGINHWQDLTWPFVRALHKNDPWLHINIIDNASNPPYTDAVQKMIRLDERVGYAQALNAGAGGTWWDWLLCCNNDCECTGKVTDIISKLGDDTVYGNAWKYDYEWMSQLGLPAVVDSAYMLISKRVWEAVGMFDPRMDAAFEEIDYCLRAIDVGFRLDVIELPIIHLNMHTRQELEGYSKRWSATSDYFKEKYAKRLQKQA